MNQFNKHTYLNSPNVLNSYKPTQTSFTNLLFHAVSFYQGRRKRREGGRGRGGGSEWFLPYKVLGKGSSAIRTFL